jgi:hypothetical protein
MELAKVETKVETMEYMSAELSVSLQAAYSAEKKVSE